MADFEMYDYLAVATPDYDQTLVLEAQQVISERGFRNQHVNEGDDGSREIITLDTDVVFFITVILKNKTTSAIGTIFDWYFDSAKANGIEKTFKWDHTTDGHTYVVQFTEELERQIMEGGIHGLGSVQLAVVGRIADA